MTLMLGKRRVIKAIAARRTSADPDDAALVGQIATGDIPAFEALYRSYYPRLTRFLEQMTRRPQLTDEILNDTMLIVWRKAATFDLSSKVSTWIIGIALRRGLKALARADDARDSAPDDVTPSAEPGPEAQLLRRELRKQLGRALMSLPVEQRAVVELSFYHGYTYREIATIVDCPVDTVKTRMFHARRRLKVLLAEHREEAA